MSRRISSFLAAAQSPVGKKILTGITGLGLVLFVMVHMLGNLTYLSGDLQAYNSYAHKLASLGPLLYLAEIGLLVLLVAHIIIGVNIYLRKRRARLHGYKVYRSAGNPSRQSLSSRTMIVSGAILIVFLIVHLKSFKFGPGMAEGYVASIDGTQVRDLKRLMTEKFQHPLYAFGYPFAIILLGYHLRHGVWSAFQSVGLLNPRVSAAVYRAGLILAVLVAAGFIVVPLYIYFSHL